jgi:hypothetical protein
MLVSVGPWAGRHRAEDQAATWIAVVGVKTLCHSLFHAVACGQWAGHRSVGRPCGRTNRAGTLTSSRRSVAPRATAKVLPASSGRRSRLWVIAASTTHALGYWLRNDPDVNIGVIGEAQNLPWVCRSGRSTSARVGEKSSRWARYSCRPPPSSSCRGDRHGCDTAQRGPSSRRTSRRNTTNTASRHAQ